MSRCALTDGAEYCDCARCVGYYIWDELDPMLTDEPVTTPQE